MPSFGDYLEDELLDHAFGAAVYTPEVTHYIGLSTTPPNDDGSNITEPVGGAYARVSKTNNLANWPAASGGAKANGTAIQFPTASAAWGTVTHFVVMDAASGGNMLGSAAMVNPKTIDNGDTASFAIGDLDITLD